MEQFIQVDTDGKGTISYDEFIAGIEDERGNKMECQEKKTFKKVFKFIDTGNSGKLSYVQYFMWKEENKEDMAEFIKLDTNNDGVIQKKEFILGIAAILGKEMKQDEKLEYATIFDSIDTDNDHEISYLEYFIWKNTKRIVKKIHPTAAKLSKNSNFIAP